MKSDIELHNGSPVYLQIHELLRAKIESGLYPAGSMIPSETELSAVYGVNRQTIHSALDGMVQEGLLRWVHGKGMFVSNGKIEQDLVELRGFTHVAQRNCRKPHTRILNQKIRPAGARYASIFNIDPSDDILYLRRLCLADGEPVTLEEIYVPQKKVPRLQALDLSVFSLREAFHLLQVPLKHAYETLTISKVCTQDARILNIEDSRDVFLVHYTSTNEADEVVEYGRCYIRGDQFSFKADYDISFADAP